MVSILAAGCNQGVNAAVEESVEEMRYLTSLVSKAQEFLPQPQEVKYADRLWEIPTGTLYVVIGNRAEPSEKVTAQELTKRLEAAYGKTGSIMLTKDTSNLLNTGTVIILGTANGNRYVRKYMQKYNLTAPPDYPGHEGYLIHCFGEDKRRIVLCAGFDALGTYYAAQLLLQLFLYRDGKLFLRPAEVVDWPVFDLRATCVVHWTVKKSPFSDQEMGQIMRATRWLGIVKFNTICISYPSGADGRVWRQPEPNYIQYLRETSRWASQRGLNVMPFVNPYCGQMGEHSPRSKIVISNKNDVDTLVYLFKTAIKAGANMAMLCMDDFVPSMWPPYRLSNEQDRSRFKDVPMQQFILSTKFTDV